MKIFPAIDLFGGSAVRLYKGDYARMTVYSANPLSVAKDFERSGAEYIHVVDLEGAKTGGTPNLETVKTIIKNTGLFAEVGGGIRSMDTVERYISAGVGRVILGTVAITDPELLEQAVERFGEKIAVSADVKDGFVAIKGWTERSDTDVVSFFERLEKVGVKTVICTDVSKDGAMQGANHSLYNKLNGKFDIDIIASGGVSSLEDVKRLSEEGLYGAIIGKAYYTGAVSVKDAIEVAK